MEELPDEAEGDDAGWPLGLQPVTLQMRLANAFSSASYIPGAHSSFLLTTPTSSSLESSDLDTESSLFSFQARSITLGSLMGMRSGSESNLIRARSLALESSCSQVSISHPHHQSCRALELCRKLVIRRQQFKRIAVDSAKFCNDFLIRFAACIQDQHKQTCCSRAHMQPIGEGVIAVPSLAHLLEMERETCSIALPVHEAAHHRTSGLINIMQEGAANVENAGQSRRFEVAAAGAGGRSQCDMNEVGLVNSRVDRGRCLNMGAIIKGRVSCKRKYTREREAHLKSPYCIPCI